VLDSRGEKVPSRQPLAAVLETITKATLVRVVQELSAHDRDFEEALRLRVAPLDAVERGGPESFDEETRRLVHSLDHLRRSEAYWQVGQVVDRVLELIHVAEGMERNEELPESAEALAGITQAYAEEWTCLDDSDGRCTEPFAAMGRLWTRILLRMHDQGLSVRRNWVELLDRVHGELVDYEVLHFGAALEAGRNGWKSTLLLVDGVSEHHPADSYEGYAEDFIRESLAEVAEEVRNESGREASAPKRKSGRKMAKKKSGRGVKNGPN
jgi:hypothetical protein